MARRRPFRFDWTDRYASCAQCQMRWEGKRAEIAARQHQERTGHMVMIQSKTTQIIGDGWKDLVESLTTGGKHG